MSRKKPKNKLERRMIPMAELRVDDSGEDPKIVGYAAVFDELSVPLWNFREKIRRGAFAKSIKEHDIRALFNHDANYVLGRTKNGTLELREDDHGLHMQITPPDTQWARDLLETMRRGDVDQSSFGFETIRDEWHKEGKDDDNIDIRTLLEVKLYDVSPVTFPAYPQTSSQVRAVLGYEMGELAGAMMRMEAGAVTEEDLELLEGFQEDLQNELTAAPAEGGHPADDEPEGDDEDAVRAYHDRKRRQLEMLEHS